MIVQSLTGSRGHRRIGRAGVRRRVNPRRGAWTRAVPASMNLP